MMFFDKISKEKKLLAIAVIATIAIISTISLIQLRSASIAHNDVPEHIQKINDKTVNFLDRAEIGLKPCLDSVENKNSTDMAIVSNCQQAVMLYRKHGGHDKLAPLYLTVIDKKDIVRADRLVDNLEKIDNKFKEIEKRNSDNLYFNQVILTQRLAQEAAEYGRKQVNEQITVDKAD